MQSRGRMIRRNRRFLCQPVQPLAQEEESLQRLCVVGLGPAALGQQIECCIGFSKSKGKRKHRSPLQRKNYDLSRFFFRKIHEPIMEESPEKITDGCPRKDV
jgi:hypothetical protein